MAASTEKGVLVSYASSSSDEDACDFSNVGNPPTIRTHSKRASTECDIGVNLKRIAGSNLTER